ncbi:MAG TPA: CPBP family intramembrane glutamic endopeptidase [Actinomycetota bacterium]|nr:CPBP family intramembrane glutamic endopeptidase [Actinomycetota bacterium]
MIPEPPGVPDRPFPPPPEGLPARPDPVAEPGPKGLAAVDWSIWEALLMGFVTNILLAQLVVGLIAFSVLGITSSDDPAAVYVGVISDLAWLGFLVLWLQMRHPGWRERLGIPMRLTGIRDAVYGWIAGLILYPAIAFAVAIPLTILFSTLSGHQATTPDQLPQNLGTGPAIASVILAVFVAPVVEELFFRGVLFRSIRDRHGFWIGAVGSGLVFGAAHYVPAAWQDTVLLQTVMVFTGIALAWIYERRGTLVADIAAHMAFNAVGIVLILAVH